MWLKPIFPMYQLMVCTSLINRKLLFFKKKYQNKRIHQKTLAFVLFGPTASGFGVYSRMWFICTMGLDKRKMIFCFLAGINYTERAVVSGRFCVHFPVSMVLCYLVWSCVVLMHGTIISLIFSFALRLPPICWSFTKKHRI